MARDGGPQRAGRAHRSASHARLAGVAFGGILASVALHSEVLAGSAAPAGNAAVLLRQADGIKTSDHAAFAAILAAFERDPQPLSPRQHEYLRYLQAWQLVYSGDYAAGIAELDDIAASAADVTLRFRAGVTAVNTLVIARRYQEAYLGLSRALALLPRVTDRDARLQGIAVAAFLYDEAGQYDLAIEYANRLLAEPVEPSGPCKGTYLKLDARMRKDGGRVTDDEVRRGIDQCEGAHEPLWANLIVAMLADARIAQGRGREAIRLLGDHYGEVQGTGYPRLMSEFDSLLGKAYWQVGDGAAAAQYARSAIEKSVKGAITKPLVDAYQVLYRAAVQRGQLKSALDLHEQYAAADRGYLDDAAERSLAYEMVSQQVLDDKRRIEALHENNQILELRGAVARKAAQAERLYLAVLGVALAMVVFWAFRTKRSQVRFQQLSRRDGLTGILNRQQFMDEAKVLLRQGAKSSRTACLILIDLDNFKTVNDTHGHLAGDGVLRQTVLTSLKHMRPADLFGRVGGEEFAVLLPDCGLEAARQRAEELRAAVAASAGAEIGAFVSASFGVTSTRESGHDLRRMFIHADSALYRAKRRGRNRVESSPDLAAAAGVA
jgi:diguanylate cyclase (GGDEF)-like protein